jgi:two-component system, cell cycle sensor histidine kinase and response regulator CckA
MAKGGFTKTSSAVDSKAQAQKVLQVARTLAATIGGDFFQTIAKHLTRALGADCVVIGEFTGGQMERIRTVGGWWDGEPASFDFELTGSAAAGLAYGKSFQYRSDARTRFPSDKLLAEVGAQAVLGVPLLDRQGRAIGAMLALYRRPVVHVNVAKQLLHIFSGRAAAELGHKIQEDELRKSEQRYRAFISKSADAMWRVEFEKPIDTSRDASEQLADAYRYGYLAECNDAMAAFVGLEKAEQAIGARLSDIAPRSDPQFEQANLDCIRNGYEFTTVEISRLDGRGRRRHLLRSQWGIVEDGMLERVWGVTRDVTELKLSMQEVGAAERRMSRLLETMKLVVVIEDPNGAIKYCNKYFYRKTGWTPTAVRGKRWPELLSPPEDRDKLLALFEAARAKPETPVHFESTILGPNSERWHFDWDRTVLTDAEGRAAAWANVGHDCGEQKILEAQLRQAQKLATIGRVAGGVAHDFNNLLTVILGYSSRLLEDRALDSQTKTTLEEIQKAASKGADLTHRLLAFGRRQLLKPEILSLNSIVADCLQMLRTLVGENIHLTTVLDNSIGLVRIDAGSFHQVLMNLAANARDAMPDGGDLTITTSNVTVAGTGVENLAAPGNYVEVTISDKGIGMSEEVREHLFEPFFTTKAEGKGTGLGLSMVWGIVQQSEGCILVETAPGKGTTFRLRFPVVAGDPPTNGEKEPAQALQRGSETILLVEDRKDVRELASATLHDLGYTVLEANGADGALELAVDGGRNIHLLLTDVMMPRINGFDLATRIRTRHSGVKVLFMSGCSEPARVSENMTLPGSVYLQKPFTPQVLARAIRQLLDSP